MEKLGLRTEDGRWVARQLLIARSFHQRLFGLLKLPPLREEEGLLLSPGASIHTFGLAYPIDAVFLNGQMRIVGLAANIRPWSARRAPPRTRHVLELPAGRIESLSLQLHRYLLVDSPFDVQRRVTRHADRPPYCDTSAVRFSLRLPAPRSCVRSARNAPSRDRAGPSARF